MRSGNQQLCPHCTGKDGIIQQQQREIERLRRIIEQAQAACADISDKASRTLSGNQPRGVWAYAKAQLQTAQTISRCLDG